MEETLLQKVQKEFVANKYPARSRAARDWFERRLRNISNLNRANILKDPLFIVRKKPSIGSIHAFFYEAKHAETLPYWDRFPLTLVLEPAEGGFYGLNLHYITVPLRALLLSRLYTIATNKRFDETTKIRASYSILKESVKYRQFKPCFKRYLFGQVRSPYTLIPASEWEMVIALPSEQFVGQTKQYVWKESEKMI